MTDELLHLAGRLHPVVLHLPIGVVAALLACEAWAIVRRRPLDASTRGVLVSLLAAASVAAAGSGLLLARESGYAGETLERHRWFGVGLAIGTLGCGFALTIGRRRVYATLLVLVALAMIPAGHLGGSMTHGNDFVTGPIRALVNAGSANDTDDSAYAREIRPIFDRACIGCHGADRAKGGLRLHDADALETGGESGPLWVAGDAGSSELVRRLRLPPEDEHHMPPADKPQLAAHEIDRLAAWIDAGASFTARARGGENGDGGPSRSTPPPSAAVAALRTALVHVETIDPASGRLWIDFRARPKMSNATIRRLLAPLLPYVEDLSLAGTAADDTLVKALGGATHLVRLDLSGTAITDEGLEALAGVSALDSLNLVQTGVGDGAVDTIATIPSLRRVYLWRTRFTEAGLATLRRRRTTLSIDAGHANAAASPIETEPPVELKPAKKG